jgi:hypothetical protein
VRFKVEVKVGRGMGFIIRLERVFLQEGKGVNYYLALKGLKFIEEIMVRLGVAEQ